MRINKETVLLGNRVVLVPYAKKHVPKYHEWMLDAELRDLTASEPLTLEEEYEMQHSWQEDEDKLTFIVLARQDSVNFTVRDDPSSRGHVSPDDPSIEALPMIGDVNLFLKGIRPELGRSRDRGEEAEDDFEVEVEIMIAEKDFRRKGLAIEALLLLLTFATGQPSSFLRPSLPVENDPLPMRSTLQPYLDWIRENKSPQILTAIIEPSRLVSRISDTNDASIKLFKKLGFSIVKRVEVFHEVEMRWQSM